MRLNDLQPVWEDAPRSIRILRRVSATFVIVALMLMVLVAAGSVLADEAMPAWTWFVRMLIAAVYAALLTQPRRHALSYVLWMLAPLFFFAVVPNRWFWTVGWLLVYVAWYRLLAQRVTRRWCGLSF